MRVDLSTPTDFAVRNTMAALAEPGATEYVPQFGDVRDASAVGVEQKTERRDQLRQIEQKIPQLT